MKFQRKIWALGMMLVISGAHASDFLTGSIYEQVGAEEGIDPILLYSVSLRESGFTPANTGLTQPWPWALCFNGRSFYGSTKKEAEKEMAYLRKAGLTNIDVGLMQVNLRWHSASLKPGEDIFDPLTNLRIGARILKSALDSASGDLVTGIGRYHSWRDSTRQANYALGVLKTYKKILKTQHVSQTLALEHIRGVDSTDKGAQ